MSRPASTCCAALEEPLRGIVSNAGMDGGVAMELVRRAQTEQKNPNIGYDVIGERTSTCCGRASSIRRR